MADVDETNEIEELELEADIDKKGSDGIGWSDNGLSLTFCMKQNIPLDIPPDIVHEIADVRPSRKFKIGILRRPSFFHQWGVYDGNNTA